MPGLSVGSDNILSCKELLDHYISGEPVVPKSEPIVLRSDPADYLHKNTKNLHSYREDAFALSSYHIVKTLWRKLHSFDL